MALQLVQDIRWVPFQQGRGVAAKHLVIRSFLGRTEAGAQHAFKRVDRSINKHLPANARPWYCP